jgi:hypothetical protein
MWNTNIHVIMAVTRAVFACACLLEDEGAFEVSTCRSLGHSHGLRSRSKARDIVNSKTDWKT